MWRMGAMHLRDFIRRQYMRQGWTVCVDLSEMNSCVPNGWVGPPPDFLAVRGSRRIAVCIETAGELQSSYLPKKWKSIVRNHGVSLQVVVRDESAREQVRRVASREEIPLDCLLVKRGTHRGGGRGNSFFTRRVRLFALVTALVFAFIFTALVLPAARKSKVPEFYRPHDRERQLEALNKEQSGVER